MVKVLILAYDGVNDLNSRLEQLQERWEVLGVQIVRNERRAYMTARAKE